MRKKIDANQTAIVKAARQCGCSVVSLASIGKGCPDVLVFVPFKGYQLWEIKDGAKCPSARKLTEDEERFHQQWKGPIQIVESIDQAIKLIESKT